MILSPTNKFVFFKPLKTAGSSVEFAFSKSCGPNDIVVGGTAQERDLGFERKNNLVWNPRTQGYEYSFHTHARPDILKKRFKQHDWEEIQSYNWISMTRNPWDTLVSFYWWSMYLSSRPHAIYKSGKPINEHVMFNYKANRTEIRKKFKIWAFGPTLPMQGAYPGEYHDTTSSQYLVKYNSLQTARPDTHIIRFENLQEDYEDVCRKCNIEIFDIPRLKTTQKKLKRHYSFYFDDEAVEKVHEEWKDYIEKFNYKFERKTLKRKRRNRKR